MRILVVDDDDDTRVFLERTLTSYGHELVTAADGLEALAAARESPPNMIVSDIMMPEMDGFALCLRLKADEKLREIPLVFYTATYTDPENMKLAVEMGASRFLVKQLERANCRWRKIAKHGKYSWGKNRISQFTEGKQACVS